MTLAYYKPGAIPTTLHKFTPGTLGGTHKPLDVSKLHTVKPPAPKKTSTKKPPPKKSPLEPKPAPAHVETPLEKNWRELQEKADAQRAAHPDWPTVVYATGGGAALRPPTHDEMSAAPAFDELHDLLGVFGIDGGTRDQGDAGAMSDELPAQDAQDAQDASTGASSSFSPLIVGALALLVLVLVVKGA